MVKVRIMNREYTLSWQEFEKFLARKTLNAPVEIVRVG